MIMISVDWPKNTAEILHLQILAMHYSAEHYKSTMLCKVSSEPKSQKNVPEK